MRTVPLSSVGALCALAIPGVAAAQDEQASAAIQPSYEVNAEYPRSSLVTADDSRIRVNALGIRAERDRIVNEPFGADTYRIRNERIYFGDPDGMRFGVYRTKEHQGFPGAVKYGTYGIALSWRF